MMRIKHTKYTKLRTKKALAFYGVFIFSRTRPRGIKLNSRAHSLFRLQLNIILLLYIPDVHINKCTHATRAASRPADANLNNNAFNSAIFSGAVSPIISKCTAQVSFLLFIAFRCNFLSLLGLWPFVL